MKSKVKSLLISSAVVLALALSGCFNDETASENKVASTGLPADTINNEAFKDLYPLQYESYYAAANDESDTKYGGSVRRSKFMDDKEPLLPILWQGYAFSLDYAEDRGHPFALEDTGGENRTLRIGDNEKQVGACLSCKSSAVPTLIETMGTDYYSGSFLNDVWPKAEEMGHSPIGCSDCHDPQTMELRITRQYAETGFEAIGIDWKTASKNEMRTLVCAQCHVEYYFADDGKTVTFPWDKGVSADAMWEYYESKSATNGDGSFAKDYVSTISGTSIIKMQHPDFETFSQGPHYKAGVACADCHMPYMVQDGKKFSSHQWTSPLKTVEISCQGCHSDKTVDQLKGLVGDIQDNHIAALHEAEEASAKAHYYVNKMITSKVDQSIIAEAQQYVRKGQMYWDYVAAENGAGFHAPQIGMQNCKTSTVASLKAIEIATAALVEKGVDLDELNAEIDKTIAAVQAEQDSTKKRDHALTDYFPNVAPQ
ncbi:MAG TPA: ammonia-forming cytochrome c nitrite reductase subunit c552 [Firmicutes bacterium]|nr:ammonia-forming cytochrome c nitrite reductase subunit c552 [Bacillales bacterium]HJA41155.1 ammonia-forming cytochrome c nitrite reductase subunit c552 [Bacillota bacterium]